MKCLVYVDLETFAYPISCICYETLVRISRLSLSVGLAKFLGSCFMITYCLAKALDIKNI